MPAQWCERLLDDGKIVRDGPYIQRGRAGSFADGQTIISGQYKLGYTVGSWDGPGGASYSGRPLDFTP